MSKSFAPARNEAQYPTNARINQMEVEESKEICNSVCGPLPKQCKTFCLFLHRRTTTTQSIEAGTSAWGCGASQQTF